mmetsp:Transcript_4430/g.10691  ORF Transcript_4430/g.10691 Transcript_4430/m.10691 type:complete len:271 (+) Transcript_4430:1068-1880(+)
MEARGILSAQLAVAALETSRLSEANSKLQRVVEQRVRREKVAAGALRLKKANSTAELVRDTRDVAVSAEIEGVVLPAPAVEAKRQAPRRFSSPERARLCSPGDALGDSSSAPAERADVLLLSGAHIETPGSSHDGGLSGLLVPNRLDVTQTFALTRTSTAGLTVSISSSRAQDGGSSRPWTPAPRTPGTPERFTGLADTTPTAQQTEHEPAVADRTREESGGARQAPDPAALVYAELLPQQTDVPQKARGMLSKLSSFFLLKSRAKGVRE